LGAILAHNPDGTEVIAFASRTLDESERKYTTTELECLAVVWALEKFRCYLEGGPEFTVVTDHASLLWLSRQKAPHGRLARWAVSLQQYRFNLVHRKGKENQGPDALSRAPVEPFSREGTSVNLVEVIGSSSD